MQKTYDIIVIGSGLGGLTAGAELASKGQRVLVLEQHFQVGGSATSFKRNGYIYEAGLHMTAMVDKESDHYDFFKKCGLLEKLNFVPAPEFYYIKGYDYEFVFGNDIKDNIRRLKEMFPKEKRGIDNYFKTIFKVHDKILQLGKYNDLGRLLALLISPFFYPKVLTSMLGNVGKFLDRCFDDERLKSILLANIGYYDDDPYDLSLAFYAIAQTGYYRKGGYYIQGGSHQLPYAMADYISGHGGDVLTSKQVTRILTENGKAIGVEYHSTKGKNAEATAERAYAPIIIANAAIPNVANELLDEKTAKPLKKKIAGMDVGPSIMTVYIAMDKPMKALGNTYYSCNYYDSKKFTLKEMAALHASDFDTRPFIMCDYSQVDSKLFPEGAGYVVLSLFDYYKDWDGLSDEEYKQKKARATNMLVDRLCAKFPGLSEHIVRVETATAKTMKHYLQTPEGTAYGFAQYPKQALIFRPGVRSPIKNLYFASAWTMPGGGFGGAMASGHFCAAEIKKILRID